MNFTQVLISWYCDHKRELPWRDTRDPYVIWISEIILQQTRVAQGYNYFLRFISRFPNVGSLARADEDEVMKYWEGLGYYSRARNLHAAAKSMNGVFPSTYEEVLALKGVGEYTAAAICSFAYEMPYAVVDGNVYRVLSRYWGIDTPIDSGQGKKLFAALAQELLDKEQPALYNQAIMDFGAMQCTPQSPDCFACPLADTCMALKANSVNRLPVKQHKIKTTNRYFNYLYVVSDGYTYIHKRMGNDIWRNLFEFPLIETDRSFSEEELLSCQPFRELFGEAGSLSVRLLCRDVKHVLSHRIIYATFYEITLPQGVSLPDGYKRVDRNDLEQYAFPQLIQKVLSL